MKHLFRILVFMALISLTGCYIGPEYYFKAKQLLPTVRDIELVYYENEHPRRMIPSENTHPIFDYEQFYYVEMLDHSLIEDFINDLTNIKFNKLNRISNAPTGYTILLHNGSTITVLSCAVINLIEYSFVAEIESYTGNFKHVYGMFNSHKDFDKLAKKYFTSFKK